MSISTKIKSVIRPKSAFEQLRYAERNKPGIIDIDGWKINYSDGPSLWSSIDVLVRKGWNDFQSTNPAPVIIDCGSNLGISVLRYKSLFPKSQITAFEPAPNIASLLKKNLAANGASDVKVVEAAVWIKNGTMPFFIEGTDGSRITENSASLAGESIQVPTVDLKDFLNGPVDMLKIDIESAEFKVVPHIADRLINVKNILVECHVDSDTMGEFSIILKTLTEAGYKLSMNTCGVWRDLIRQPAKAPNEFDQYVLVVGWR